MSGSTSDLQAAERDTALSVERDLSGGHSDETDATEQLEAAQPARSEAR